MNVQRAYKFKLKTKYDIEKLFSQYAGCCRFVWNHFLYLQKQRLEAKEKLYSYNQLSSMLTALKRVEEYSWLRDCYSVLLQQTLRDLDRAIWQALKKDSDKRFPLFKRKGEKNGFRYPAAFAVDAGVIHLPKMKQGIRYFDSRPLSGELRNLTITREVDGWYCSIQTQQQVADPVHISDSVVGIDRGVANLVALSDGTLLEGMSFTIERQKLARLQRHLSRKQMSSSNWKKQKRKIAKLHHSIANKRKDRLHKLSNTLSKNHAVVVMESLPVKNMTRSAAGTIEAPGKNVKAKNGLNRVILEQGWGELRRQLTYKLNWRGGRLLHVPAQYTSQRCGVCGHTEAGNRQTQSQFACNQCGHQDHADINAARNILAAGLAVIACGEGAIAPSVKQEPPIAA